MAWLNSLLIVVQVICAVSVIILILLQHGKGADMGAAFGGGASGSLFGASGSANFLSRSTAVLATVFFLATIGMAYTATAARQAAAGADRGGVMGTIGKPAPAPAPAGTAPAGGAGDIPATPTPQNSAAPAPTGTTQGPTSANPPANRPADIPK
ncbi:MAG TPA: preprotein translocase subunit SecG [Burkholderiaceae bacterium]|jgi:preprotein translocase subunit SecG|nr:preprotein translocase subunit SecG [Burkholderiaceae bacterium]